MPSSESLFLSLGVAPVLLQVSLAAQRRWLASLAAAAAARNDGTDSLSKHDEEMEEKRLYRQV